MTRLLSEALSEVASARDRVENTRRADALARARLESAVVRACRAGAPQREVAERAGVSQPYVSQVLAANRERFVPTSELGYLLAAHRREVHDVVARYRGGNVAVFGSVARGDDRPGSDIDLLVDIPEDMGLITMAKMEQELNEILDASVDVVPARLVRPEVRRTAAGDAVRL